MKNKLLFLFIALLTLVTSVYFQRRVKPTLPVVSGIKYDKSIKTEHGVPIKVTQVIDGDTIVLVNGDHLRYVGIDTPEEFDQRKPVQCFAKEAAEKNKQLAEGKTIKFYKDVEETDKYGRWLGFVYLEDGTFVNMELVKQGYAFAYPYPPDVSKSAEFLAAEISARTNKLGLWGGLCSISTLSTGRQQTNPIQ
ncbi:MAG: thermonuclease family protein [Candidatus Doudnabacteria bacterium]